MSDAAVASARGGLELRLTDCLAPFFAGLSPTAVETVNWSKAPFTAIEDGRLGDADWERRFIAEADRYLTAVASQGYTAVAIDDLAHLVSWPWYSEDLRKTVGAWRRLLRQLFTRARECDLEIFVTSDFFFSNPAIDAYLRATGITAEDFFVATVERALGDFPEIDGLVLRTGESDGVDVVGGFVSRLQIRRPSEARRLLSRLLPLFERRGKTLIVRTWTLGAYPIGDLIWNPRTWDAVFAGIDSPSLVVSLKYGDADFFRFLPLNPLFFRGPQRKLVELQCRREYEGMGEYPAFVGWQYERYLNELVAGNANLAGVYAINAGGWASFSKLPFCGGGSFWSEVNATVVADLASGFSVEDSVRQICTAASIAEVEKFLELLRLSDEAIADGLYIREVAERQLYFRRVRIPPLTWIFWQYVSTGGLVSLVHRCLVRDSHRAVAEGHRAVAAVARMLDLARQLGLDESPFQFQLDSFRLLALHREVLLGVATDETYRRIDELMPAYTSQYPSGYRFGGSAVGDPGREHRVALLLPMLLRSQAAYRWRDRLHLNPPASRLLRVLVKQLSASLPQFAGQQGMRPDTLLR